MRQIERPKPKRLRTGLREMPSRRCVGMQSRERGSAVRLVWVPPGETYRNRSEQCARWLVAGPVVATCMECMPSPDMSAGDSTNAGGGTAAAAAYAASQVCGSTVGAVLRARTRTESGGGGALSVRGYSPSSA